MSRLTDERQLSASERLLSASRLPSEAVPLSDSGLRVDPPHLLQNASSPQSSATGHFPNPHAVPPVASEKQPRIDPGQWFLQAGQIAEHLKQQTLEIDRREQRLHAHLAQLDEERRTVRLWASTQEEQIFERDGALAKREADCSARMTACLTFEEELQQRREALLRHESELRTLRDQIEVERQQALADIAAEKSAHDLALVTDRETLELERADLQAEFRHDRSLLESRIRFQEDHLGRMRHELETAQSEFRAEQQHARTDAMQRSTLQELRQRQLVHVRELLDQREQSLERESQQLQKARRAMEEAQRADRRDLEQQQEEWLRTRELERADLQRQHDMLALHAENLEARRVRLDKLRGELEESNRVTLESRLAVEEATSQLSTVAGADAARQRIDEARQILSEYYRHTRDGLTAQRLELEQSQARLQQQLDDLRQERIALKNWLSQQEESLTTQRAELDTAHKAIATRDEQMRLAAAKWAEDKLDAERTIRSLLDQFDQNAVAPVNSVNRT